MLSRTQVLLWYKRFKKGREDVNDDARPQPMKTMKQLRKLFWIIVESLLKRCSWCWHIVWLRQQKLLNFDIAQEVLTTLKDDTNLLEKVITGDVSWFYGYNIELKAQSYQWKRPEEPKSKNSLQGRSNVEVLLTVFFDCNSVVHHEFLSQGLTANKEYCLEVMSQLCKVNSQKRRELWKNQSWILHHDNSAAHT